eukprot:TRINITY_DN59709_c0_g1_i1.p2 TRINITY_DN59709_c0_g1~~TRINITY_DN59709_c0_g1_i1.p2  ORF type:complete len:203 (+),score=53.57 TRINITY_DN59709_c0_g1_i1:114-722(+)
MCSRGCGVASVVLLVAVVLPAYPRILAELQFRVGVVYAAGHGVPQSDVKAGEWYTKAAWRGHADAQTNLGWMLLQGFGSHVTVNTFVKAKNESAALEWFSRAAKQNHAQAETNLGLMYAQGLGVQRNLTEASRWLQRAAGRGHHGARNRLAKMYAAGDLGDLLQHPESSAATTAAVAADAGGEQATSDAASDAEPQAASAAA